MSTDHCRLPYRNTGSFTKLAVDYAEAAPGLHPFIAHEVSDKGIMAAIEARKNFATPRRVLVEVLKEQYGNISLTEVQKLHLDSLLQPDSFAIITAHQPNIFTGPLYFIYKILHAIKLADELKAKWPQYNFVPVYYMGSEDADLEELGFIYAGGQKLTWQTTQSGAVGRMHTQGLETIIDALRNQFQFFPFGKEMISMLEDAYSDAPSIQEATLKLVNRLFADFGLLVLIPDHPKLKQEYIKVMELEISEGYSSKLVSQTIEKLGESYKVQAAGREINLFYLFEDGRRERIEKTGGNYRVLFSDLRFTEAEILTELNQHPERFSPNVILRGMFQESILPGIAFIGGGGEIAYWLELKALFEASGVPYPVLILRNSFLLLNGKAAALKQKLGLTEEELFLPLLDQENLIVKRLHGKDPDTLEAQQELARLYEQLMKGVENVDPTLIAHVEALFKKAQNGLEGLAKKMKRAERRKISDESRQLESLKEMLFPNGSLQERLENFMPYYAQYGPGLLQQLYDQSLTLEQEFTLSYLS